MIIYILLYILYTIYTFYNTRSVITRVILMIALPPPPAFLSLSINPITGHVEEPGPNPMEEMTEEQKEYEAQKLVNMFDKLSR